MVIGGFVAPVEGPSNDLTRVQASKAESLRRFTEKLVNESKLNLDDDDWLENYDFGLLDIPKEDKPNQRATFENSESKTELFKKKMAFFDLDKNTAFSGNKYGLFDNLMDDFERNTSKHPAALIPGPKDQTVRS